MGLSSDGRVLATIDNVFQLDTSGGEVALPPTTDMLLNALSGDGTTVVGVVYGDPQPVEGPAIISSTTLDGLQTAAARFAENGIDLTRNILLQAKSVSADGRVVVGTAGPSADGGPTRYWLATYAAFASVASNGDGGAGGAGGTTD